MYLKLFRRFYEKYILEKQRDRTDSCYRVKSEVFVNEEERIGRLDVVWPGRLTEVARQKDVRMG